MKRKLMATPYTNKWHSENKVIKNGVIILWTCYKQKKNWGKLDIQLFQISSNYSRPNISIFRLHEHTHTQNTHMNNPFLYPTSLSKISADRNKDNLSQPVYIWMSFLPKLAKKKKKANYVMKIITKY